MGEKVPHTYLYVFLLSERAGSCLWSCAPHRSSDPITRHCTGRLIQSHDETTKHPTAACTRYLLDSYPHYARFAHHWRPHHCRICENWQWCTFVAGYKLENEKMIEARVKPAVKDHITASLWLAPAVSWRPLADSDLVLSLSVLAKDRRW